MEKFTINYQLGCRLVVSDDPGAVEYYTLRLDYPNQRSCEFTVKFKRYRRNKVGDDWELLVGATLDEYNAITQLIYNAVSDHNERITHRLSKLWSAPHIPKVSILAIYIPLLETVEYVSGQSS